MIHVFANGGASQVDTFDPKPMLGKYAGKPLPTGNLKTERKTGAAFPSPFKFRKYGQSGLEISDMFPKVAESADGRPTASMKPADATDSASASRPTRARRLSAGLRGGHGA
jgi:hypothetical protein